VDGKGLVSFQVCLRETDLHLLAPADCSVRVMEHVVRLRNQLENRIAAQPAFLTSLVPLEADPLAPPIVRDMLRASAAAGVGPMAAVAGAVAEHVGAALVREFGFAEIVVENGGDIYLQRAEDCRVAIFAGPSPLSNRIGLLLRASAMPCGVCTSSATVGHSLSLGTADAVTVVAPSTSLADAAATWIGNAAKGADGVRQALDAAKAIKGISGVVVVMGERLGAWGEVELIEIG